jgi:CRISPR-associated protein Csx16
MTKTFFVSGHAGAHEWAQRRGIDAQLVRHLDVSQVAAGDTVIGSLPAHVAAEVCTRGARFFHLAMELGEDDRRRELSADEMEDFGARLVEIRAEIVGEGN